MSAKPRLLFLSQTMPYPPDGGVWIRTYNLIRALSAEFSIEMLCFERAISGLDGFAFDPAESLAALREIGPAEVFPLPQRHSRARFAWDHFRSLLTGRAFTHYLYDSGAFRTAVRAAVRRGYALAHVDSLDLCTYLPELGDAPIACTHHNVESALLRRRAKAERSGLVRLYAAYQARLTEKDERRWCPQVALNVAVSDDDAATLRALAPGGRYVVVPNGVDVEAFRPGADSRDGGLVFVGAASWFPNRDGMEYFCQEILPLLRRRRPDLPVTWIGAARTEDQRRLKDEHGVALTGHVPDIRPYVQAAQCYVVPLRVGGGSRLKILDAWAMGKAVVSTSIGCEGLAAEDGQNILLGDTPEAFAAAIERVLDSDELRRRLGAGARKTAEARYSWEVVGRTLVEAYMELLGRPTSAPPMVGR